MVRCGEWCIYMVRCGEWYVVRCGGCQKWDEWCALWCMVYLHGALWWMVCALCGALWRMVYLHGFLWCKVCGVLWWLSEVG